MQPDILENIEAQRKDLSTSINSPEDKEKPPETLIEPQKKPLSSTVRKP